MKSNRNLINGLLGTTLGSMLGLALIAQVNHRINANNHKGLPVRQERKVVRTNTSPVQAQPVYQAPITNYFSNTPVPVVPTVPAVNTDNTNTTYNPQTMNLSQEGLRFIARHEALRTNRYNDVAGIPTIGYGHVIRTGENYTNITPAQAENLLYNDAQRAVNAVRGTITNNLSQNQFDSLVSFTFNVGNGAFRNSTLARMINSGDTNAPAQFGRWVNAGGRRVQGLVNRRVDERALYEMR